jgi:hypothetical protein
MLHGKTQEFSEDREIPVESRFEYGVLVERRAGQAIGYGSLWSAPSKASPTVSA